MSKEKIILIIIIVLIIIVICILGLMKMLQPKEEQNIILSEDEGIIEFEEDKLLREVTSRDDYYIVKKSIEKFYTSYSELFKDPLEGYLIEPEEGTVDVELIKSKRKETVYRMLDTKYLEYKQINLGNIESALPKVGNISINITNMYYIKNAKNIFAYFVYGTKNDTLNSTTTDFKIMVKTDFKNRTYKILLDDYVEKFYQNINIGQYIEITEEEIENDKYNIFSYESILDREYVNDLFTHYKNTLRQNKEQSYNLLNEEYKRKCFNNVDEYLSFLNSNYTKIVTGILESYNTDTTDSYVQYLLKDTKGNYYIFRETAPFKYTVILDNYVIPTKSFTEEYNKISEAKKVVLDIEKFFMGIDDKNYGYSYSLLSDSFKNNKYPTKNDFINYAKESFFEKNKIEYEKYEKENGVYIYEVKITDATGIRHEERTFNMIIKLKSGTDFEMSFGED